jgi:oxygen-dependent protoporphyrinogen oxidase
MFATVWGGLTRLTEALAAGLGERRIRRGAVVDAVRPSSSGYEIQVAGDRIEAEAVVLATPAFEAGRLLREVDQVAAEAASAIPYASTAVVELVFPQGTVDVLPPGTGCVVPPGQGSVTASTWISRKWPREEFGSRAVVRCFVGRAGDQAVLDAPDADLLEAALGELRRAGAGLPAAEASSVVRWPRSMPQYEVGHLDRVAALDRALAGRPGLFVTGAAYRGVGIADCVRQAGETAERVRDYLGGRGAPGPAVASLDEEAITWTT